eukprot:205019-Chlamydomonas_euryale.AAC.1
MVWTVAVCLRGAWTCAKGGMLRLARCMFGIMVVEQVAGQIHTLARGWPGGVGEVMWCILSRGQRL